jgi:hypothetical protein
MSRKKEEVKETKQAKKETVIKKETLVYCGPSLRDLPQYSVFQGELPQYVQKHIEKSEVIKELFVAPKDLVSTRKRITETGTREHQLFNKVLEYVRGGSN